jgi:hypothetical protein
MRRTEAPMPTPVPVPVQAPKPVVKPKVDLFERARQKGFDEGIKATAKHFKAPMKATISSVRGSLMKSPIMPDPDAAVSPAASKPVSSWLNHVRETHAKNGGSMKDAMRLAKESYRAELR